MRDKPTSTAVSTNIPSSTRIHHSLLQSIRIGHAPRPFTHSLTRLHIACRITVTRYIRPLSPSQSSPVAVKETEQRPKLKIRVSQYVINPSARQHAISLHSPPPSPQLPTVTIPPQQDFFWYRHQHN